MEKLNPNATEPLYQQLAKQIIQKIRAEKLVSGQKIPSIRALADQYQVSTITVIRALDELRKHQYLYSIHGKGYFVAQHHVIQKYMPTQDGFSDMAEKEGMMPSSIVLRKEIQAAGREMEKEFGVDPESEMVILERVRLLDDCPLCIQISYLPHELCYGVLEYDFKNFSLYHVLRNYYHIYMAKSQYIIQAGLAEARELQHLNLQAPAAILWVQHWAFESSGRLFEYGKTAYRADCFQINSPINDYQITGEFNA